MIDKSKSISHLDYIEFYFKHSRKVVVSICQTKKKVDLGGLKNTSKMKRSMFVKVGCTSTKIQLWGHKEKNPKLRLKLRIT